MLVGHADGLGRERVLRRYRDQRDAAAVAAEAGVMRQARATGVPVPDRVALARLAAQNVKRVFAADDDWAAPPRPARLQAFLEVKTVWHPIGL